jgi:hypothetical protein
MFFSYLVLLNSVGVVDTAVVLADPQVILLVDTVLDHIPADQKEYKTKRTRTQMSSVLADQ